jgi:hypothetical protein
MVTTYFEDYPAFFEEITPLVDSRLDLRCILTEPPTGNRPVEAAKELKSLGWNVKTYDGYATFNCFIIDDVTAILTDFTYDKITGKVKLTKIENPDLVTQILYHFHNLWNQSDSSLIYEDLLLSSVPENQRTIYQASRDTWNELIKSLVNKPDLIYSLEPRKFEEMVAELLFREGMEVELTGKTRDGGRDILAKTNTASGTHLYLVECKRYAKKNLVSVDIVRALYGVVESERATGGIIVTSSDFSSDAIKFKEQIKYRMEFKNYNNILKLLKKT